MTTNLRLVSVSEQKKLIPDAAVRAYFMKRPDIKALPRAERERRWRKHQAGLKAFREFLSTLPCVGVIDASQPENPCVK